MPTLPLATNRPDDFQTPAWPVDVLVPYLPRGIVWECASGQGKLAAALEAHGIQVIPTDIKNGFDFLIHSPPVQYDCIVTNPPYSLKDEFLTRAYSLGKPFAFLIPLTSFEGLKRQALYRKHGLQVIFLPRRVNFETPSGKGSGSWFATAWFTSGLNLPHDMIFTPSL